MDRVLNSILNKELKDYKINVLLVTIDGKVLNKEENFEKNGLNDFNEIVVHCQNLVKRKRSLKTSGNGGDSGSNYYSSKLTPFKERKVINFPDGSVYDGEVENGVACGKGLQKYDDGSYYEGEFDNNQRNGKGIYVWKNGGQYVGEFINNEKSGFGLYKYPSGASYEGEFYRDKKHGQGKYKYVTGEIYNGEWSDGKKNGYGEMIYKDGSVKKGRWLNNNLVG